MARSAVKATRWSRTTLGFTADLALYVVIALSLWLVVPMLILGWTPVLITSGSMSPAVEPGDVLLIERGLPEGEWFVPGTIITYEAAPTVTASGGALASGPGHATANDPRLVTHRVDRIDPDGNYVTRGDANGSTDVRPVAADQVVGAARLLVPSIGLPVHWARDGRLLQIGLVAFALLGTVFASRLDAAGRERPLAQDAQGDRDLEDLSAAPDRTEPIKPSPRRRYPTRGVTDPATLAARAARAARAGSGAGVAQLPDRPSDDEEPATGEPKRRSIGLPPAGAVMGILALSLGSLLPTTEAAFAASNDNSGSRFATAQATFDADAVITHDQDQSYCAEVTVTTDWPTAVPWEVQLDLSTAPLDGTPWTATGADIEFEHPILTASGTTDNATAAAGSPTTWTFCASRHGDGDPPPTMILPEHEGSPVLEPDDNPGSSATYAFDFTYGHDVHLDGYAIAELAVERVAPGGSPGEVAIVISAGGVPIASGSSGDVRGDGWQTITFPLDDQDPILDTFPAGTTFTVEVELRRLRVELDGASQILLPL